MPIRSIIFDVGGVFSHHKNLKPLNPWVERFNMSAKEILYAVFDSEVSSRASLGQATVAEIWDFANQQFGLSETDKQALMVDVWATQTWDNELLDFVRTLKPNYKLGVLSDAWPNARATNVPITYDLFDVIVYSTEEGLRKPDPEIYRRTLERLEVTPEEAIYVDDSPHKVEGAKQVGMHALLFTDSVAIRQQITELLGRE